MNIKNTVNFAGLLAIFFLLLILVTPGKISAQQTSVVPSMVCLGACPTIPASNTTNAPQAQTTITIPPGAVTSAPSASAPTTANATPTPNCQPVTVNSASAEAAAHSRRHRSRKGGKGNNSQGLLDTILKLIQDLTKLIQQLTGGGIPGSTLPNTNNPVPTQNPNNQNQTGGGGGTPKVTLPFCPTNTPAVQPTSGQTQPTTAQPTSGQGQPTTAPTPGTTTPAQSASAPILPAVNGPCPEFKTGIVTFTPKNAPANQAQLYVGPNPGNGPLVFYFHGTGEASGFSSKGPSWLGQSVIDDIMAKGGVAIIPKGHGGYEWIIADGSTAETDLFLIDEMVACAVEKAKIDPKQIYSTGLSSGATLTSDLIHRRSNYLAAGAPQSGGWDPYNPIPANQNPNNKIAAMIIHGGPSDSWPSNACEVYEPQSIIMANKLLQEGSFPVLCNQGGGHRNIPDRTAVWTFFQAHPFNVTPKPWANGLPAGFPSYCEVYKGDKQASMPGSCAY